MNHPLIRTFQRGFIDWHDILRVPVANDVCRVSVKQQERERESDRYRACVDNEQCL
jgi:hypothetical protein